MARPADQLRVLIVDDSIFICDELRDALTKDPKIIVDIAHDGAFARKTASRYPPHVIIMDIHLVGESGLDLIDWFMAKHPVPILVMTSDTDPELRREMLRRGALDIVYKSLELLESPEAIEQFCANLKLIASITVVRHVERSTREATRDARVQQTTDDPPPGPARRRGPGSSQSIPRPGVSASTSSLRIERPRSHGALADPSASQPRRPRSPGSSQSIPRPGVNVPTSSLRIERPRSSPSARSTQSIARPRSAPHDAPQPQRLRRPGSSQSIPRPDANASVSTLRIERPRGHASGARPHGSYDAQGPQRSAAKTTALGLDRPVTGKSPTPSKPTSQLTPPSEDSGGLLSSRPPPSTSAWAMIALVASTGGPRALAEILSRFPAYFPAGFVLVQHLSEGFAQNLVAWLGRSTQLRVMIAAQHQFVRPGELLIAPDGHHLTIEPDLRVRLIRHRDSGQQHCPSGDLLLESVARSCRNRAIGVVLTGMGDDGARGLLELSRAGGHTIAQDEASSSVFGMPRAAIGLGAARSVLPLEAIGPELCMLAGVPPSSRPSPGSGGERLK